MAENRKQAHRAALLDAALTRFGAQGYHKTGLAEIAQDAGISMAHIYNFFPDKQSLALETLTIQSDRLARSIKAEATRKADAPAAQIAQFLREELDQTHALLEQSPGLVSVMDMCARKAPDIANAMLAQFRSGLTQILTLGHLSGALRVDDAEWTAEIIQIATLKFRFPQWSNQLSLPALQHELEGVTRLLLEGLVRRRPGA